MHYTYTYGITRNSHVRTFLDDLFHFCIISTLFIFCGSDYLFINPLLYNIVHSMSCLTTILVTMGMDAP